VQRYRTSAVQWNRRRDRRTGRRRAARHRTRTGSRLRAATRRQRSFLRALCYFTRFSYILLILMYRPTSGTEVTNRYAISTRPTVPTTFLAITRVFINLASQRSVTQRFLLRRRRSSHERLLVLRLSCKSLSPLPSPCDPYLWLPVFFALPESCSSKVCFPLPKLMLVQTCGLSKKRHPSECIR
jgi:hypothetical protein